MLMDLSVSASGVVMGGVSTIFPAMHKNPQFHIGIDPDINFNGVAVYAKKSKMLVYCDCLKYFDIMRLLQEYRNGFVNKQQSFLVHIEGGWVVEKSNFHSETKQYVREKIAKNVGSNHESGRKIVEMCIEYDFPFTVRKPIAPRFKDERFFKMVTGWQEATNADSRSAANYVYGY